MATAKVAIVAIFLTTHKTIKPSLRPHNTNASFLLAQMSELWNAVSRENAGSRAYSSRNRSSPRVHK
jgi:hypothetical protein